MSKNVLNFKLEFSEKEKITPYAGLGLYGEMYRALGLHWEANEVLPVARSGKGFEANEYVNPLVMMFVGGGKYIEDIRKIKADKGLREICKLEVVPSGDAIGDWLRRESLDKKRGLKRINDNLSLRIVRKTENKELTLDIDATEIVAEKDNAKYTYEGNKGYMPMLGFIPEVDWCINYEFREGNVPPAERNYEFLKESIELVEQANKQITCCRIDAAGYQAKVINYLHSHQTRYTITADQDCAVKEAIQGIAETDWKQLKDKTGVHTGREYAEVIHTMNKSDHSFRLVVQRWLNPQLELFSEEKYYYHCIATDYLLEEKNSEEIIWWHNGRSNSENYNKELKQGFNLDYVPCNEFQANAVWFSVGILAYNLFMASKIFLLPRSWIKKTIGTIRWQFIQLAGKIIRRGRYLILRISGTLREIFEVYRKARSRCWELEKFFAV